MTSDITPNMRWPTVLAFLGGGLFMAVGVVWLLFLATSNSRTNSVVAERMATAASVPAVVAPGGGAWVNPTLVADDLGSGSAEFSAVALNASNDRLLIADDEGLIFEFDLSEAGMPIVPPRRTIRVGFGGSDIEGLAWMFDSTYVIAHENDGRLSVVEIDDDTMTITAQDRVRAVETGIGPDDGNGLEGVTYLGGEVEFAVVDERPPTVVLIRRDGVVTQSVPLELGLADVSDVWADANGNLMLLSDQGRVVVTISIDADGTVTRLGSLDLVLPQGRFEQPEGVVGTADGGRLYIVGESPGPQSFSFGFWSAEPAG